MRILEGGRASVASLALVLAAAFAGCLGDRPTAPDEGGGGTGGAGGLAGGGTAGHGTGGAGGKASGGSGGASSGTGGPVLGSGGAAGGKGTGGTAATGGTTATGGIVGTGGATGTGGAVATGGVTGTGGMAATGGARGTGGIVATGGVSGTGGIAGTGGVIGTGGIPATGGMTGTGGTAPVCTLGQTRCVNNDTEAESCQSNGQWGTATSCTYTCVGTSCAACTPGTLQCTSTTANELCGTNGQWETAVACPLPPPSPSCLNGHCAYHAGYDQFGGSDSLPASYIYAVRFLATASTKAYRLGMFGTATGGTVRLGLYSESTLQMPSTLVAQTATTLATANGAIEGALTPTLLTANTHYWIAAIAESNTSIGVTQGGPGFVYNTVGTWPSMPSTFPATGAGSDTAETADFYIVLQDQ
jgi:hypothetical protein